MTKLGLDNYQQMVQLRQEDREAATAGWNLMGKFKRLMGILIMCSILKMIVFPTASPPTDEELF